MKSIIYQPSADLQPYISHYRIWRFDKTTPHNITFKDYPRIAMNMLFLFKGKIKVLLPDEVMQLDSCTFTGLFDKAYSIMPISDIEILDVQFKPNGVYPLTKTPLRYGKNQQVPLTELLNDSINDLYHKMGESKDDLLKIQLVENYLLQQYKESSKHHRLEYCLQLIDQSKGLVRVKKLSEKLHSSYKNLDRWFKQHIGLSPKQYIQLTRFKYILQSLAKNL